MGTPQLRIVQPAEVAEDQPTPAPRPMRAPPAKPVGLSQDAEWLWDRAVEQLEHLLKPVDAAALEVVCETFARWREAVRFRQQHALLGKNSQGTVAAPWIGIEERASREFRAWCAEFGLTPATEAALSLEGGHDHRSTDPD